MYSVHLNKAGNESLLSFPTAKERVKYARQQACYAAFGVASEECQNRVLEEVKRLTKFGLPFDILDLIERFC